MRTDFASDYGTYEEKHWWFRARREILATFLSTHWSLPTPEILEIGVGPGLNLYTLYPADAKLYGLEPEADNAKRAQALGSIPVFTGTLENLPQELASRRYDMITMFDVLEHIENDSAAIAKVRALLEPGGEFVLSVPAYRWLWGQQDEVNLHFRRYTRSHLCALLAEQGFVVCRSTYFNTFLFLPIALFRVFAALNPWRSQFSASDFKYSLGTLDRLLFSIFRAESIWLRRWNFPFGVSILVSAKSAQSHQ